MKRILNILKQLILIILTGLISFALLIAGSLLLHAFNSAAGLELSAMGDVMQTAYQYYYFIWTALVCVIWLLIIKNNRPILKTLGTMPSGNNVRFLLIGLAVGGVMNLICAAAAMLNGDVFLYFSSADIMAALFVFLGVFVQSSTEELLCRGYIYQRLYKITGSHLAAILLNPLLFAAAHIGNSGLTALSLLNIYLVGVLFSLMIYYMDSLWCACAAHAAWNFMQNIILGLPNSGLVTPFSIFKLDASVARDSFFYNVGFGVEGTGFACVIILLGCAAMCLWGRKHGKKPIDVWGNSATAE